MSSPSSLDEDDRLSGHWPAALEALWGSAVAARRTLRLKNHKLLGIL